MVPTYVGLLSLSNHGTAVLFLFPQMVFFLWMATKFMILLILGHFYASLVWKFLYKLYVFSQVFSTLFELDYFFGDYFIVIRFPLKIRVD